MSSVAIRIHGLFAEAWERRRRRRVLVLAVAMVGAVVVALATRPGSPPAPVAPRVAALALPQEPGIGVACPGAPNSIDCDRIGIAVWVRRAPARLLATIDGHSVLLQDQTIQCPARHPQCDQLFVGYLSHAGLLDGALKVRPDHGPLWYGSNPAHATLGLRATYGHGRVEATTRRVELRAGFG